MQSCREYRNADMDNHPLQQQAQTRQVGLMDLFALIAFFMPIYATIGMVKRSGGGPLRYLLALPLAVALGTLIVSIDWKLGRVIWLRSGSYSKTVKNGVGFCLFVLQLFWIFVGAMSGDRLATFLVNHVAR
jgi:hypothetical protein